MSSLDHISGQWDAYNRVLNFLNTLEDNLVDKKKIYKAVSDMRPREYQYE